MNKKFRKNLSKNTYSDNDEWEFSNNVCKLSKENFQKAYHMR